MFLLQYELRNGSVSVPLWIADGPEHARVSKSDGSQSLDLQRDALRAEDIDFLSNLFHTVQDLSARGVGLRVLACQGAQIDTTTAVGRLVCGIFAVLAEFERELIRERTMVGLKFALSKAQVWLAQAAMAHRDTSVSELCTELGIKPVTLYRYVGPQGQLRGQGDKVLDT